MSWKEKKRSTTLLISRNAATNGQRLFLAFFSSVVRTKAASIVLQPRLKPNCSSPRSLFSSTASVIRSHILTVIKRRILEGMVTGRYWDGSSVFPPCQKYKLQFITIRLGKYPPWRLACTCQCSRPQAQPLHWESYLKTKAGIFETSDWRSSKVR